jgi:hypothetical protein
MSGFKFVNLKCDFCCIFNNKQFIEFSDQRNLSLRSPTPKMIQEF